MITRETVVGYVCTMVGISLLTFGAFDIFHTPPGVILLCFGSWHLVKTFKSNSRQGDSIFKKNSWTAVIIFVLTLAQFCLLVFQIQGLVRYQEQMAPYMSTLRSAGDTVTKPFYLWTIIIPFFSQLVFLPVIGILYRYAPLNYRGGAYAFLLLIWINCVSLHALFSAVLSAMLTYD